MLAKSTKIDKANGSNKINILFLSSLLHLILLTHFCVTCMHIADTVDAVFIAVHLHFEYT